MQRKSASTHLRQLTQHQPQLPGPAAITDSTTSAAPAARAPHRPLRESRSPARTRQPEKARPIPGSTANTPVRPAPRLADRRQHRKASVGFLSAGRGLTSIGIEEPAWFSEPGVFLVKPDRTLYYGSTQSMPFARPQFQDLLGAIDFAIAKDYPARGEYEGTA